MTCRRLAAIALLGAGIGVAPAARAGDFDLDDEKPSARPAASDQSAAPPTAIATIGGHAYTLTECLALADRNYPNLWAARARLANYHGQLEEAKFTPFSYWGASSTFGVAPPVGGSIFYNNVPVTIAGTSFPDGWQPFLQFSVNGRIPLYTFGKIGSIRRAAEAQVRLGEWDLEKARQSVRMDVRRAFFGLMLARDALYIGDEVRGRLNSAIQGIADKLDRADTSVEESDKLRMELYRDELLARIAEARRGESYATAALRFLTGVQTAFDIPDEPLKRPDVVVGPVVRYLTAARLFRPDVNIARAGVVARRAQVDFARANLFPTLGLGGNFNYSIAPSIVPASSGFNGVAGNGLSAVGAFGIDWPLDLLPRNARVHQAEAQLEEARSLERLALGGVAVEVENAYAIAVEAKTKEENWDRAEHRARHWMSFIQDAIDLGTKDERSLIEPLRAYVFARANHAQSLMDFNVALSELARVSGWDAAAPGS